jgi:N6-L-threonylcarbamoyladenine synthase
MIEMNNLYLGIDTSNYTSSIAVINVDGIILEDRRIILEVPNGKSGLRQQEAVFQHVKNIPLLFEKTDFEIDKVNTIAVSTKPRRLPNSYMPVFKVGLSYAKVISQLNDIPIKLFSHQEGHIASLIYTNNFDEDIFIALHLSGGTTEVVLVNNADNFYTTILGGTKDISFGQLIDRIGVYAGIEFPCGRRMEEISRNGKILNIDLPKPQASIWLNLSGLENFYKKLIDSKKYNIRDIFYTLFFNIALFIEMLIRKAMDIHHISTTLIVGGVISNNIIKNYLSNSFYEAKIYFSEKNLSSDNAVGIAYLGKYKLGWED